MKRLLLAVLAFLLPLLAHSEPLVEAREGGILVTLHTEVCTLPAVSNLPNRAQWVEKGVTHEGCWSMDPTLSFVVAYFDDKTVVAMPARLFVKVTNL